MTLRDFLNAIFSLIGAESLTDEEFGTVDEDTPVGIYDQALYDVLSAILIERDAVSNTKDRLVAFFKVKNVDVSETETPTNILIGGSLE